MNETSLQNGPESRISSARAGTLLFVEFIADHLPELAEDFVLSLLPLLLVEHLQSALLVGRVDLVLLAHAHSLHTAMSEITERLALSTFGYVGDICEHGRHSLQVVDA